MEEQEAKSRMQFLDQRTNKIDPAKKKLEQCKRK
jgi:hypothetical protein